MHARNLLWLPALVAALLMSCAPVDETPTGKQPEKLPTPAESNTPPTAAGHKERIELALRNIRERDLLTTNSFWTVFHGILGVGPDRATLLTPAGQRVNAVDYITRGGKIRGMRFIPTADGLDVETAGAGGERFVSQGHQDQFVAEMVEWGLPLNRKFLIDGKEYQFEDFVRHSQARTRTTADQELSWAIVILSSCRGTDIEWTNREGEKLRFEDVVRYELNQPIDTAACGGTHRLFGLTWAYHLHLRKGGQKTGIWKDVADKLDHYKQIARKYQNADGTFSTQYLAGPGNVRDAQLRIGTTGHVLEWLTLALTDDELKQPWVQDAANALAMLILENSGSSIESGAMYHAAHGLYLYHERLFGSMKSDKAHLVVPLL